MHPPAFATRYPRLRALARLGALAGVLAAVTLPTAAPASAQVHRDEQFYYPGSFNWEFLRNYPEAARLFNAFDYGHAVLYERLYQYGDRADAPLEKEYRYLTTDLLVRPPRFAIAEEAVMPRYAKVAWRAKQMFDWAHLLHRQLYDVYADERLSPAARDSVIEQLTDYYLARREYAFTDRPKSMALMDEQYFSQVFRKRYPKFNGLIWSYHWLQVGLYEPFIEAQGAGERKAAVQATVARFWSMLEDAPSRFPKYMPMTPAIAPKFTAAHPRAAIVFDNLHMMHDIISDILAADTIPRDRKAAMIDEQLDKLQDSTRDVMSDAEWRNMADHMGGVAAMGGPAVGLLQAVEDPETPPGMAGMAGMQHGEPAPMAKPDTAGMAGMQHGAGPTPGMQHGAAADSAGRAPSLGAPAADAPGLRPEDRRMEVGRPSGGAARARRDTSAAPDGGSMRAMMELHERMMRDPVIRQRVMADTAMRRMMQGMDLPQEPAPPPSGAADGHGGHPGAAPGNRTAVPPRRAPKPAARPAPRSAPAPARDSMPGDRSMPMDHDAMPGMRRDSTPKKP